MQAADGVAVAIEAACEGLVIGRLIDLGGGGRVEAVVIRTAIADGQETVLRDVIAGVVGRVIIVEVLHPISASGIGGIDIRCLDVMRSERFFQRERFVEFFILEAGSDALQFREGVHFPWIFRRASRVLRIAPRIALIGVTRSQSQQAAQEKNCQKRTHGGRSLMRVIKRPRQAR